VRFKNLAALLLAITDMDDVELTIAGEGPDSLRLRTLAASLRLERRVVFVTAAHGENKAQLFETHDLLILPSITEISPNVALEARAAGLPVLLTDTTGLSDGLREGMTIARLRSPSDIVTAVRDVIARYDAIASAAASPPPRRSWADVAEEHVAMFQGMGHED
jgi:glycosyltransferase involved in cell wall biosynthesis